MRALYISLSLVCLTMNGRSQTLLKISDIIPGSENVQLVLSWPTSATAFSLQAAASVSTGNTNWQVVTNTVIRTNTQETVTISNSNAQRFFRLGIEVDPCTLNRKLLMGYQ